MDMKICLDTNVFLSVKNREEDAQHCENILDLIDEGKVKGVISTIVVAEVCAGFYGNEESEAEEFVEHIAALYEIVPIDLEIAVESARLRRKYGLKLPDAMIIITSKKADVFITKDKELKKIKDLKILTPKEFVGYMKRRHKEGNK